MSSIPIKPQNLPEALIWYYIIFTYPIYFLGAHFVLAPLLATFLTGYLIFQWWNQTEETPIEERIIISSSAWVWVIAVLVIEVALIVGHLNFNLEIKRIITSSILWYRTWGLMALFPLIGHLNIRAKLIYRAICILCLQCLIIIIIGCIAKLVGIPNIVYTSPLKLLGGIPKQFEVEVFNIFSKDRLKLFALWPTFLALLCNIYFFFALQDHDKKWRLIGLFSATFMIVATQSRTATLCLPFVFISVWMLTNIFRPWVQFLLGFVSLISGLFSLKLIDFMTNFKEQFDNFRAGSSKVRNIIYRMSLRRWWNEAPIWGLSIRDSGGEVVTNLPLGSHHTWIGALFSYGLVGCGALAFAFIWSFIDLLIKAQTSETAKVGLSVILILFICSLADNIEFFSYLYWPGLIILGIAFNENQ